MNVSYKGEVDVVCNKLLEDRRDPNSIMIRLVMNAADLSQIFRRDGKEFIKVESDNEKQYLITYKVTPNVDMEKIYQVILTDIETKDMYLVVNSGIFFNAVLNEYMKIAFTEKLQYMMEFDFEESIVHEEYLEDEFEIEEDLDE